MEGTLEESVKGVGNEALNLRKVNISKQIFLI